MPWFVGKWRLRKFEVYVAWDWFVHPPMSLSWLLSYRLFVLIVAIRV